MSDLPVFPSFARPSKVSKCSSSANTCLRRYNRSELDSQVHRTATLWKSVTHDRHQCSSKKRFHRTHGIRSHLEDIGISCRQRNRLRTISRLRSLRTLHCFLPDVSGNGQRKRQSAGPNLSYASCHRRSARINRDGQGTSGPLS